MNDGAGGAPPVERAGGSAGEAHDQPAQAGQSDDGSAESGDVGARPPQPVKLGGEGGAAGAPNDANAGESSGASAGASTGGSDGTSRGTAGSAGAAGGSVGTGGATDPNEGLMIPCDVDAAYATCRVCHNVPPLAGAPFPLLTLDDLQANATSEYGDVATGAMPLGAALSPKDKTTILDWLQDGAPGVPQADCP